MAQPFKQIVPVTLVQSAATLLYTSPAQTTTVITKCDSINPDITTAYTFDFYLVPAGAAPTSVNALVYQRPIAPGETYVVIEAQGMVLGPGDKIYALGSTTNKIQLAVSGLVSVGG